MSPINRLVDAPAIGTTIPRLPPLHFSLPGGLPLRVGQFGRQLALALSFPLFLLALWQIACERLWLPPQILPPPALVWETLCDMLASGEIAEHLAASLRRVAWSILLGGSGGLALGFAMGLSPRARAYLYPSFALFAQFPVIAWSPLMLIFFGIDEALKISTITLAVVVPFAVATLKGIENVPVKLMEIGRVYRFSFTQTWRRIALPAALPAVLGGVRQGCMQAWLALVFVELLASSEGIGYLLVYARNLMQLDVVMVCMAVIGLVGLAFDLALGCVERHFGQPQSKGR